MPLVMPEGVPVLGNTKVKAVLTIADPTQPALASEINAVTSLDVSFYLYPAGWAPTGATAKGTKPSRLASKYDREALNRTTWSMGALQYVYDPSVSGSAAVNKAKTMLTYGLKIHLLERKGLDAELVDFAVGQFTRDHYMQLGAQIPGGDNTDQNAEHMIMQELIYVGVAGPVDGIVVT